MTVAYQDRSGLSQQTHKLVAPWRIMWSKYATNRK